MKNEWSIKFRVKDRNLFKVHKKSILCDINLEVPTELLNGSYGLILRKIEEIENAKRIMKLYKQT
ncbi:MAG: hypothetical protein UT24_C0016G0045 [Candidatus Woesebacteria bacterium GW2011_GWB1_39_12]|uniref:Uncharacterized protein n=1 Tax=Candidatus Woesebacteria bacterium GW2011_GWB1_39_12 TaxID=1618574 RepID=A0A0G0MII7_9BACT|nr:MAG: hypothetical protein UT24_C0016G0045 [Candidatus Woesebacteria bacterium GW2011_GWB1_39_12]